MISLTISPIRETDSAQSAKGRAAAFCSRLAAKISALFKRIIEPLAGYFLKISFFQKIPSSDWFSKRIVAPLSLGILKLWQRSQGIPSQRTAFDSGRLEKSRAFLSEFGDWKTAKTADGREIRWGFFQAAKFERWIASHGGVRDGEWIRPRTDADWPRLAQLNEFKWFEQTGEAFRIPEKIEGMEDRCILRCPGFGRSMPMDKAFIGLHLASGFDYALLDWREDLGVEGIYNDIEALYQAVRSEGFPADRIKAIGSCRATFAVSRLMELHHAEGLDAVLIHPPPSLSAVVANQPWPANRIGLLGLGAVEQKGADFDTIRRIRELPQGSEERGRLCVVLSEGDRILPPDTEQRIRDAAAESNCPVEWIIQKKQGETDPHLEEPLRNQEVLASYLSFLSGKASFATGSKKKTAAAQ